MQPLNEITVGSYLSELQLSEVFEHFSYPNTLWGVPGRIRDFNTMGIIQHYKHYTEY